MYVISPQSPTASSLLHERSAGRWVQARVGTDVSEAKISWLTGLLKMEVLAYMVGFDLSLMLQA